MGKITLFLFLGTLIGCSSTNCRRYHDLNTATKTKWVGEKGEATLNQKVKIYKPDGSLQCGMGQTIPAEVMQKELGDIKVFTAENRSDGLMHIQVCGSPTGMINVFEIQQGDLDQALKKGFKVLPE